MDSNIILQSLRTLHPRPNRGDLSFSVCPLVAGASAGWIGQNQQSGIAFLLRTSAQEARHPAIDLPLIRVRHGMRVEIDDGNTRREEVVSLLECLSHDDRTIELFTRAVGGVLPDNPNVVRSSDLGEIVEQLLALFRDFSYASDSEILGLWGELLILTYCSSPAKLATQWRSDISSRYDFGTEVEKLEVKTTTLPRRHHELAFRQAYPASGTIVAFASIMTEKVSHGTSVAALWHQVIARAPASQAKIDRQCIRTLGRDWQDASETSFDLAMALSSLSVYSSSDIPRLQSLPTGVLQARFTSDFERAKKWHGLPPSPDGPIAAALGCVGLRQH